MGKCTRCNSEESENDFRFAIVATASSSETQNYVVAKKTTTTVYEKLTSVERTCICNSCIKKERVMYVLKWTALIAFGVFAALAVAGLRTGSFGAWVFIGLAIGTVIGAICVLIHAMGRKDAFFASDIRSAATSKKDSTKYRFVPVESSLYIAKGQDKPDIGTFKERSGLRTSVADNIFEKFIVPGNGNEMIDSIIAGSRTDN